MSRWPSCTPRTQKGCVNTAQDVSPREEWAPSTLDAQRGRRRPHSLAVDGVKSCLPPLVKEKPYSTVNTFSPKLLFLSCFCKGFRKRNIRRSVVEDCPNIQHHWITAVTLLGRYSTVILSPTPPESGSSRRPRAIPRASPSVPERHVRAAARMAHGVR
jgi:hypothetical protein